MKLGSNGMEWEIGFELRTEEKEEALQRKL